MIEIERGDRGSARGGQSDDFIILPSEVRAPSMYSRMEKWNVDSCVRVGGNDTVRLVKIAAGTRPGQVFQFAVAAARRGKNMLQMKSCAL